MSTERTATLKAVREVARAVLLKWEDDDYLGSGAKIAPLNEKYDGDLQLRRKLRAVLLRDADAASRAAAKRYSLQVDTPPGTDTPPEEPPVLDLTDRKTLEAIRRAAVQYAMTEQLCPLNAVYDRLTAVLDRLDLAATERESQEARREQPRPPRQPSDN